MKPLMTRLPDDLHTLLVNAAGVNHRSLNSEMVYRLGRSFVEDSGWASKAVSDAMRENFALEQK